MIGRSRLLSGFLTLISSLLIVYIILLNNSIADDNNSSSNSIKRISDDNSKNNSINKQIVSYSLLKQIEIESEEYCKKKLIINTSINDESIISDDGEGDEVKKPSSSSWVKIKNTNLFVYSIYYDKRLEPYQYLRIIAMVKGSYLLSKNNYCQILNSNGDYQVTKIIVKKIWSNNWGVLENERNYYNPLLLSCRVPPSRSPDSVPIALSIISNNVPCVINREQLLKINLININDGKSELIKYKYLFTICVKPLDFIDEDISKRLLQWIVINQILGADKIVFYITNNLHKKVWKLLRTLQELSTNSNNNKKIVLINKRFKEIIPNSLKSKLLWQKRRYELIVYNDCFYRNIHTSHFIIPIDIDEIIIPKTADTWLELLNSTLIKDKGKFASFSVQNAYYLTDFTTISRKSEESDDDNNIFFFRDIIRSELSDAGESGKSFISTSNTLTVFNHYALDVLKPGLVNTQFLSSEIVQMNHYKKTCSILVLPECAKYLSSSIRIVDNISFKYKKLFYSKYKELLGQLKRFGIFIS